MASVIRGSDNFDSSDIVEGNAKAWINFDGSVADVANNGERDSYNISSLVDSGTGNYTVNLSVTMVNTNYVCLANSAQTTSNTFGEDVIAHVNSTTQVSVRTANPTNAAARDAALVYLVIFGD